MNVTVKTYEFSIVWALRADVVKCPESAVSQGEMRIRSTSPEAAEAEFHAAHPDKISWAVWHFDEWANRNKDAVTDAPATTPAQTLTKREQRIDAERRACADGAEQTRDLVIGKLVELENAAYFNDESDTTGCALRSLIEWMHDGIDFVEVPTYEEMS